MNPPTFEARCVGMHFRGERAKALAEALTPSSPLGLEREPFNPHDPNAIKVLYTSLSGEVEHIGYIQRDIASFVAPWMDDGVEYSAKFIELQLAKNVAYPFLKLIPAAKTQQTADHGEEVTA